MSPTVLEADRAFCEALADWINTANAHASKDDFGRGTIDPPSMSSLIADFAEIIELAPGELHADMQLLVDRVVSDRDADEVQAANRRVEAWAVLHCRFAMDGANLQGDPGTTQQAGVTVVTSGAPPGTSGAVGTDTWPPGSAPVISAR